MRFTLIAFILLFSFSAAQPSRALENLQLAANNNLACSIWPKIASTATKGQVEAFLSECKDGIFNRLAKARLGELKGSNARTDTLPLPDPTTKDDEPAKQLYLRAKNFQYGQNGERKDYAKALDLFFRAAKQGHAKSMTDIGWMHENGFGTQKNDKVALQWYEKAAEKGESMAFNNLGWMYTQGKTISQDYNKAVRYYRRAIALGEPLAMTNLGWMYETGKGVKQDDTQAFTYYKKAADAGDLQGLHNTGWMYATGRGVKRSAKKGADAVFEAISKKNKFSIEQMTGNYSVWPQDFRKQMQKNLKTHGYYNGKADGKFGPETVSAIRAAAE